MGTENAHQNVVETCGAQKEGSKDGRGSRRVVVDNTICTKGTEEDVEVGIGRRVCNPPTFKGSITYQLSYCNKDSEHVIEERMILNYGGYTL